MSKVAIFATERQNYVFVKILLYFVFENVQFVINVVSTQSKFFPLFRISLLVETIESINS